MQIFVYILRLCLPRDPMSAGTGNFGWFVDCSLLFTNQNFGGNPRSIWSAIPARDICLQRELLFFLNGIDSALIVHLCSSLFIIVYHLNNLKVRKMQSRNIIHRLNFDCLSLFTLFLLNPCPCWSFYRMYRRENSIRKRQNKRNWRQSRWVHDDYIDATQFMKTDFEEIEEPE